jgi:cobalt-zinc-cadmium efflux system membrane fusion protein
MNEMNSQTQDQKRGRGNRYARFVGGLAVALLIVAGLVRLTGGKGAEAEPQAEPSRPGPSSSDAIEATPEQLKEIRVESVREQDVDFNFQTTGKVDFNEDRMTPVVTPYAGRVLELLANKGDVVKAGQPLLVVESPDLVNAVNDLSQARSDADKAKLAMEIADTVVQRDRRLNAQEALATKELQAAESDLSRARQDYSRAVASISVIRNRLALFGKNSEEIAQFEQPITDQIDLRVVIRAPLDGTIVERKVGPGQYIKPDSSDPLYLISDLSAVWVTADVYENDLAHVHVGAPVEIAVNAYPGRKFPARISAINPTVDPATRAIRVRCLVPNPDGLLKPEMFANILIGNAEKRKALTVPLTAVLTQGAGSIVLREESPGRFTRRSVKAGPEIKGAVVVEEGLAARDRVVTSGVLLLNHENPESEGK